MTLLERRTREAEATRERAILNAALRLSEDGEMDKLTKFEAIRRVSLAPVIKWVKAE